MTPEEIARLPYRPCVGVMLTNATGKIFVGQRNDRHKDAWQMPQGGIDPGEDPADAALRELEEETGVTGDLVDIIARSPDWLRYDLPHELVPNIWKGRYRGQEQLWFLMRFQGTDGDIDIETKKPEFSRWKWIEPSELLPNIVPFKREVYADVLRAFAPRV